MTLIEQTRMLGAAIQQDKRYKNYHEAARINDTDPNVQKKIGEFNLLRAQLNRELAKEDKDADTMTTLDKEIRELYDEIMAMPSMVAFNQAKEEIDRLLASIEYIISSSANGEDPFTCDEQPPQCSGSCSTCDGCH
ncbi:MAG: YlbF family regulator [Ruminococcus sp.]|nr:YlbF family regulator [Ruminococcus sp.]